MGLVGKALIIQNKGGGHGSIGYHVCNSLISENPDLEVMILQDKCNYAKQPFASYEELKNRGEVMKSIIMFFLLTILST